MTSSKFVTVKVNRHTTHAQLHIRDTQCTSMADGRAWQTYVYWRTIYHTIRFVSCITCVAYMHVSETKYSVSSH